MTAGPENRRLEIAVYGIADKKSGSVGSAGSLILDEILRRGHRVDFYSGKGYVDPLELNSYDQFRFLPIRARGTAAGWSLIDRIPRSGRAPANLLYSQYSNARHNQDIAAAITKEHAGRRYDALLTLGMLSPFRVDGLPTVSWPQGPPLSEWRTDPVAPRPPWTIHRQGTLHGPGGAISLQASHQPEASRLQRPDPLRQPMGRSASGSTLGFVLNRSSQSPIRSTSRCSAWDRTRNQPRGRLWAGSSGWGGSCPEKGLTWCWMLIES